MEYLLLHYGYAFLIFGLIIEGDATLVAAMILASQPGQRYLDMRWVMGLALAVTVGGNELLYEVGALGWMKGRMGSGRHYRTVSRWLHSSRSGYLTLLFSRFMWGFRLMIPVAAGLLHIRRRRFSTSNLIGGVVWVGVLAYSGVAVQSLLVLLHDDLMRYQSHIAVGLFLMGILIGLATIPWQITRQGTKRRATDGLVRRPSSVVVPGKPPGLAGSTSQATASRGPEPGAASTLKQPLAP